jgi:hypothetical protein
MVDAVVSGGRGAHRALILDDGRVDFDPAHSGGNDNTGLAMVWARSDAPREVLTRWAPPDDDRRAPRAFLSMRLPTLFLDSRMRFFLTGLNRDEAPKGRSASTSFSSRRSA